MQTPHAVTPRSNRTGIRQAYDLRDFAAQAALELKAIPAKSIEEACDRAQAFKNYATVWDYASDRIRILRGRPLPGSKRPAPEPRKLRKKSLPQSFALGPAPESSAEDLPSREAIDPHSEAKPD